MQKFTPGEFRRLPVISSNTAAHTQVKVGREFLFDHMTHQSLEHNVQVYYCVVVGDTGAIEMRSGKIYREEKTKI